MHNPMFERKTETGAILNIF